MNKYPFAQIMLAVIVTFGFFYCIFYMLRWGFPQENKDALNALMGVLTTIFTLQQNFFFGSSSGSVAKDIIMGSIAQSSSPNVNITNTDKVTGNINLDTKPKEPIVTETSKEN